MGNNTEHLQINEIIIRICPITKKVVLAQYLGGNEIIDLHSNTIQEDIKEVLKHIKPYI